MSAFDIKLIICFGTDGADYNALVYSHVVHAFSHLPLFT